LLDDLPELLRDAEEAIRGTEALQTLVGPAVVVVLHPEPDPLTGGVEAIELGPLQELLPDGLPEAFDLPQGHGVMGPALQVMDMVLLELGFEAGGAPPAGELPALVGQHLLGDVVLGDRAAIDLEDVLGRLTAEDVQPHHVAGVVIQEADEIGVLPAQTEREDVALPQLVGRGALEGPGDRPVGLGLEAALREEGMLMESAAYRLPAHGEQEHAAQEVADLLDPEVGVALLQRHGLSLHHRGDMRLGAPQTALPLEAGFALDAIAAHPVP